MEVVINTESVEATQAVARRIGARLKGSEVVELISDLGGGKTTFVHGLAKGIGSTDRVASPTFTISRLYQGKTLELHHFDFYRLDDAGLMEHELHDVIGQPETIVVVEWGDVVAHVLPQARMTIRLTRTGDQSRKLTCQVPDKLAYLIEGLQ